MIMGNLHLVTGYAGEAHVTAADAASLNAAIIGSDNYVLNRGSKLSASIVTNNKITIADGDLLMQGRHIRLNEGSTVDLAIENGVSGRYRNDLIVARYTRDSSTGVEDCNLIVIKGTAVSSNPTDPEYTSGDIINDHVLVVDMPLYRVPLNGLNVQEPVCLFSVIDITLSNLYKEQQSVGKQLEDLSKNTLKKSELLLACWPVGSIYQSEIETSPASLFGGTWERLKDRFLLAAGDIYKAGVTGGEAEHTLTIEEMPEHRHSTTNVHSYTSSGSYGVNSGKYTDVFDRYTSYAGGSQPHNNMPPYIAVYAWRRIA